MFDPGVLPRIPDSGPPIARGRLAILLLLIAETMLFVGFLGAFAIVRFQSGIWPMPYEVKGEFVFPPRVELGWPVANAVVLTLGFIFAVLAQRAARRDNAGATRRFLVMATLFGAAFVGGIVMEFRHEAARGLTIWSGQYGAMVLSITAAHAAHVFGGVVWNICLVLSRLTTSVGGVRYDRVGHLGVYFGFVTFLWYVLLGLLYLA